MTKKSPIFSIIIPVRYETAYLRETLKHLKKQSFTTFEVLVITDKISATPSPAVKRNLGAKMAKGIYLAFLDDDSYPHKNWLKNAYTQFLKDKSLAAVCGPCLTPPDDSPTQKASGLLWSSFLGSGGAGTFRNQISSPRFVDDFPSVNLIVKKSDFKQVGGFDTHHWPGEDTILCLNLVYKLKKRIYYHPSVVVYHHRRSVIIPHLKQITRYALHRGYFARIYPKTSLKIGYLLPTFFVLYLVSLFFVSATLFFIPLFIYLFLLLITFILFLTHKNNIKTSLMAAITIPITHIYYGILFFKGYISPNLDFQPHHANQKGYIGG